MTPPLRRLSVQVWADTTGEGFVAYVPETDTEVAGPTFDQAQSRALAAAAAVMAQQNTPEKEDAVVPQPEAPRWNCICGRSNPDGRTDCSACGSPRL